MVKSQFNSSFDVLLVTLWSDCQHGEKGEISQLQYLLALSLNVK